MHTHTHTHTRIHRASINDSMCASRLVLAFFRMLFTSNSTPVIDRRYRATQKKEEDDDEEEKKKRTTDVNWFFTHCYYFVQETAS